MHSLKWLSTLEGKKGFAARYFCPNVANVEALDREVEKMIVHKYSIES